MKVLEALVSIIVPFYNSELFLDDCVQSVLNQTHRNWELFLIDDGSIDASTSIAKKYSDDIKIFYLHHENRANNGVAKSRMLGLNAAKGEFIAFLDADDLFIPEKIEHQLLILQKFKDVILIHSKVNVINSTDVHYNFEFDIGKNSFSYSLSEQPYYLKENVICNSTVLIRKSILNLENLEITKLFQFEDWLLWNLIADKGKFYYDSMPTTKYRFHEFSYTYKLNTNVLLHNYSKLEMLFQLILTDINNITRLCIAKEVEDQLFNLFHIYNNENEFNPVQKKKIKFLYYKIEKLLNKRLKNNRYSFYKKMKQKVALYWNIIRIYNKVK